MTSDVAPEGAGWMARCDCGWEHYQTLRRSVDSAASKHVCPKPKVTHEKRTSGASSTAWTVREEGSSWIDKL